jgi:hypothetical protein
MSEGLDLGIEALKGIKKSIKKWDEADKALLDAINGVKEEVKKLPCNRDHGISGKEPDDPDLVYGGW